MFRIRVFTLGASFCSNWLSVSTDPDLARQLIQRMPSQFPEHRTDKTLRTTSSTRNFGTRLLKSHSSCGHQKSAIHHERSSGDEGCPIAGEKCDCFRNFLWLPDPAHGMHLTECVKGFFLGRCIRGHGTQQWSVYRSRTYAICPNVVARE